MNTKIRKAKGEVKKMFKRTGMPSELKAIDFNGPDSIECKCEKCGHVIGRAAGGFMQVGKTMTRQSSANVTCPACGLKG